MGGGESEWHEMEERLFEKKVVLQGKSGQHTRGHCVMWSG